MLHLGHCESRRPLGPENVEADGPVTVDVGVVDTRRECKFGRLERVVCRKVDIQEEDTTCGEKLMVGVMVKLNI